MPHSRVVIIHGHFYQPPREDPWLEEIPRQAGAAPWHDWNEKIDRECYRAVVAARVLDGDGKIARLANTLTHMSFDIGPTLFEWMERASPSTYAAILEADRRSVERTGHGNAIAQPYHHSILPLASRRDKVTEVRWGIADFRRRFGREPEGMWLPETAIDDETLDVLAQEGITFTIVAPGQVKHVPPDGRMGRYTTRSGREIAIGIYDGSLSHGVAFGRLLTNARVWKAEVLAGHERQHGPEIVTIATDGETYGHHHKFSEMALAWLLWELDRTLAVRVSNFGEMLEALPPVHDVEIVGPSSWSCEHGVERWRSNCGCRIDASQPARQEWRAPLRDGLAELRALLDARFETEGARYFRAPWAARDAYGAVVAADDATRDAAVDELLLPKRTARDKVRARELLEMARDGLRMFTSCAWFFDDIGGLEPVQNLRYAARAIELAGDSDGAIERALLDHLRLAISSDPAVGSGEDVWVRTVRPMISPLVRLAAAAAACDQFVPGWRAPAGNAYDVAIHGKRVRLTHRRTGRHTAFDVAASLHGVAGIQAYVHPRPDLDDDASGPPPLAGSIPVVLDEFPERERDLVREAIRAPGRRELATRLLGETILLEVAHGDQSLVSATVGALQYEVDRLAADPSPARVTRAIELIDLLDLIGHHTPFDVQTAFARALTQLAPGARAAMRALADRLGFSAEILLDESAEQPPHDAVMR
jgi:alpha-amylase/alpha-mannosidase (GH57 family)